MRVIDSGSPLVFKLLGTDTWGLSRGPPVVKLFSYTKYIAIMYYLHNCLKN